MYFFVRVALQNCFRRKGASQIVLFIGKRRFSRFSKLHDECCHRITKNFFEHHKQWLKGNYKVPVLIAKAPTVPDEAKQRVVHGGGRPRLSYEAQSKRSKRRTVNEASKVLDHNTNLALDTARYVAARNGDVQVVSVISSVKGVQSIENKKIEESFMMTPDAALALLLECELTKEQYRKIRNAAIAHGHNFLPSYDKVLDAKKACRPKNVVVEETASLYKTLLIILFLELFKVNMILSSTK